MGLFSDVDWVIIVAVAAFLLFGRENAQVLRTLGRWYGRAVRLKQELLSEVSQAAEIPVDSLHAPSLRAAFLGMGTGGLPGAEFPVSTSAPALVARSVPAAPEIPWTGGSPILSWSVTGVPPEIGGFQ
jgi:hypothetical protein